MTRRVLLGLACALALCFGLPTTALAASYVPYIDEDGASQVISDAQEVTSGDTQWTRGWYVVQGDVTISGRVTVSGSGYVHLILADGCNLTVGEGIEVEEGAHFLIFGQSEDEATMGALHASNAVSSAAIGASLSNNSTPSGPITINGGKIEARSDGSGAAIGGGYNAPGGPVTINGGIVSARAARGAGIGGGVDGTGYGRGGQVTIAGGSVTALSASGAGIGGGEGNFNHGTLTISPKSGRAISASTGEGAEDAQVLEGSPFLPGAAAQVSGGELGRKYFSTESKALLTVSYLDEVGNEQTRTDCLAVTASDRQWKDGWYAVGSSATVEGRIVVDGDANLILTDGRALVVKGGIEVSEGNSLTIYAQSADASSMGSLLATTRNSGFSDCAAIGGGYAEGAADAGSIAIHGGSVTADNAGGYSRAAGIGGGYWNPSQSGDKAEGGAGGEVTITGGVVTALGGWNAAGIGGGQQSDGGVVTISGGTVMATGGDAFGAGIGGGDRGDGGVVTITGGTVVARADSGSHAIGSGANTSSAEASGSATLTIDPAQGSAIAARAGNGEEDAVPLDGSPFVSAREVSGLVRDASYFRSACGDVADITRIVGQPQDATVDEGGAVRFEVSAHGMGALAYQWQHRSGAGGSWADIEGATDSSYTASAVAADMDGAQFRCVVSGELGDAMSDAASLTVIPRPIFRISLSSHELGFGTLVEGASSEGAARKTVMITNDGNQPLRIALPESQAFEFEPAALSGQLDPGDTVDVSIKPKDGLAAGAYRESAVVVGANGQNTAAANLELSLDVVHDMVKTEAKPASCTEDGNSTYWTCGACGKIFGDERGEDEIELEDTVVPAAGHSWGEDGRCEVCGAMNPDFSSTAGTDDKKGSGGNQGPDGKKASDGKKEPLAETGDGFGAIVTACSILASTAIAAGALGLTGSRRS